MSLLTLLLGILSLLASYSGVSLPAPEPAVVALPPRELVLEPQCEYEITGREEERMMAAIRFRCEMVGLRGVKVERRERNFILQVNNGLIPRMEEYTETLDELEAVLNESTQMRLLRVHTYSDRLVNDAEVQEMLVAYETALIAFEESAEPGETAPVLPELPHRLGAPGYMLAEYQVLSPEDGSARFEYLVVQRPELAAEEDVLVTEGDVDRAEYDAMRGSINLTFTGRGADALTRLTRSMKMGRERMAIMLNGVVVSAPVVHAELGMECFISGLSAECCESVVDGLAMPLPVPVKITARRGVE